MTTSIQLKIKPRPLPHQEVGAFFVGGEMKINSKACPFSLNRKLVTILEEEIAKAAVAPSGGGVCLNFRDPDYSAEDGGYHPVEVRFEQDGTLSYITDFCFVGLGPFAELTKEIDFDFSLNIFGHMGIDRPLEEGRELFAVWQANFCTYYERGVYRVLIS